MLNGILDNYTKVFFGADTWPEFVKEVASYGHSVLVVLGSDSQRRRKLKIKLSEALDGEHASVHYLEDVAPNPNADKVYEGIAIAQENAVRVVVAAGGGSVVDTAKAIAVGAQVRHDFFDFFTEISTPKSSLPVAVLLTLSGSGSESSDGCVITKEGLKRACGAPFMYPRCAFLDPSLQLSVPSYLLACGVYDSIAHVMERYFSNTTNVATTSALGIALIKNIMTLGLSALENIDDVELRGDLIWAQKLAHDNTVGFGRKQCWGVHTIAHEIGARTNLPHGAILSALYPAWMSFIAKEQPEAVCQFGKKVFGLNEAGEIKSVALDTVARMSAFSNAIGLPANLHELGCNLESSFEDIAAGCSSTTVSGTIGNFRRLNRSEIVTILELASDV